LEKFREIVAPHYVAMEIKLITSDDTKMSPQASKLLEDGVTWAKNGRMDRACEQWIQAQSLHGTDYAIPYLLGVCSEVQGNLEGAEEYYRKADRNTGSPKEEISEALGRVRVKIDNRAKLGDQIKR
jgi:Flp pilus assembly protein TadD